MKFVFETEQEMSKRFPEARIRNGMVKHIDIDVIGHFGNLVTLDMPIESHGGICSPLLGYNATLPCGVYIRLLFELFNISEENGKRISEVKNIPCRVLEHGMEIVAIGNFMSDKFIAVADFSKCYDEVMSEVKDEN